MNYYLLKIGTIERKLPIVSLGRGIKVASFNLLGDSEMVEKIALLMVKKLAKTDFDLLVGPEVKVVPLLHEITRILGKKRYVVCRKNIHGYMVSPVISYHKPGLILDGNDAAFLKGKNVVVIDDVVSSGLTMRVADELIESVGGKVVAHAAVFKQGERNGGFFKNLISLGTLPVFKSS